MSRAVNRRLVLNLLRREGALSRAGIAVRTGLSAPTVTSMVAGLIEQGLLTEGEAAAGALGRRPVPLSLNYGGSVAIGAKLMPAGMDCVVTDLSTAPLATLRRDLPDSRPESYVEALAGAIADLRQEAGRVDTPLVGVGLSLPGVVDAGAGICRRSERLDWTEVPLAGMAAARFGVPVWLEDDTNAFAIAEHLFGLGRLHQNMAVLAIGAGISCALIVDGKLYRGARGAAGKLGHVLEDPSGPRCECGRRGCLQALCSERAIVDAWRRSQGLPTGRPGHADMLAALDAGDKTALAILAAAGRVVGRHLATVVNLVDPEIVVVGGEAVAFGRPLFDAIEASLAEHAFREPPPIRHGWDDLSWARGAAALATQRLFDFEQTGHGD